MVVAPTERRVGILRLTGQVRRQLLWALFFVSPWVIGFLVFTVGPMIASLYYSFTDFSVIKAPEWVGLANYGNLLTNDDHLFQALGNTFYMVAVGIPVTQVFAYLTALLLNMRVRGTRLYRTVYFLPAIMPEVPVTIIWAWIFNPQLGPVNSVISSLGLTP